MLQQSQADDFVLATGTRNRVQDFLEASFAAVGLDPARYVELDPRFVRPSEVAKLVGDPSKAAERLDWRAATKLPELARLMVEHDVSMMRRQPPVS
jgi:GDPmannose 4,6-dehydratase